MIKLNTPILFLLLTYLGFAQNTYTGNLTLTTQAEIDAFNYTEVTGDLTVDEATAGNILNLNGLATLAQVGGQLRIFRNEQLTSLNGLEALVSVGGILRIDSNNLITSLSGLENLASVGSNLHVTSNWALTTLNGLDALASVDGELDMDRNYSLTNLCAISGLFGDGAGQISEEEYVLIGNGYNPTYTEIQNMTDCSITSTATVYAGSIILTSQAEVDAFSITQPNITGSLVITEATPNNITNLNTLTSINTIGGEVFIQSNDALTSLSGLDNLTTVGGNFFIDDNFSLTSLNGLDALSTVRDYFYVYRNESIITLSGLDALTTVGRFFRVRDNQSLTAFNSLNALTTVATSFWVWDNNELVSFNGLTNLTTIGENVQIFQNDALTSLNGLDNLTSVAGNLNINTNIELEEYCAIGSLIGDTDPGQISEAEYSVFDNGYNPTYTEIQGTTTCSTLSVNAEVKSTSIRVFPNPSNNYIQISGISEKLSYSLYDTLGKAVKQGSISNNEKINIISLPKGLYYLNIGNTIYKKVITK
ncbi:T9SS type A sorting domain-containing protein [Algibacter sp. AS12]|uniref:T9SS type A sorting domain-containing protein n=1 Tax=Algibacter sp. AS12 TaxID=3135773 RepID=UPI00398B64FC